METDTDLEDSSDLLHVSRRSIRHLIEELGIRVTFSSEMRTHEAILLDLSKDGFRIGSSDVDRLYRNDFVTLIASGQAVGLKDGQVCHLTACVCWVNRESKTAGGRFLELTAEQRTVVDKILNWAESCEKSMVEAEQTKAA